MNFDVIYKKLKPVKICVFSSIDSHTEERKNTHFRRMEKIL